MPGETVLQYLNELAEKRRKRDQQLDTLAEMLSVLAERREVAEGTPTAQPLPIGSEAAVAQATPEDLYGALMRAASRRGAIPRTPTATPTPLEGPFEATPTARPTPVTRETRRQEMLAAGVSPEDVERELNRPVMAEEGILGPTALLPIPGVGLLGRGVKAAFGLKAGAKTAKGELIHEGDRLARAAALPTAEALKGGTARDFTRVSGISGARRWLAAQPPAFEAEIKGANAYARRIAQEPIPRELIESGTPITYDTFSEAFIRKYGYIPGDEIVNDVVKALPDDAATLRLLSRLHTNEGAEALAVEKMLVESQGAVTARLDTLRETLWYKLQAFIPRNLALNVMPGLRQYTNAAVRTVLNYKTYAELRHHLLSRDLLLMHRDERALFTSELLPTPLTRPGGVAAGEKDAWTIIGRYVYDPALTAKQTYMRFMEVAAYFPDQFTWAPGALGKAQRRYVVGAAQLLNDEYMLAKEAGVKIEEIERYVLPRIYQFDKKLVAEDGGLVPEFYTRLVGAKRIAQHQRQYPVPWLAWEAGYRMRDDITSLADLFAVRRAQTTRMIADARFEAAAKTLSDVEAKTVRDIVSKQADKPLGILQEISMLGRALKLTLDLAVVGVQSPAMAMHLLDHPTRTLHAYTTAFHAFFAPEGYKAYVAMNYESMVRAANAGMKNSIKVLERPGEGATFIERVVPGLRHLNEAQFGRSLNVLKHEAWQMNVEMLTSGSRINTVLAGVDTRLAKGLPLPEAERVAATVVNEIFGGIDDALLMQGPTLKALERILFLTPNFTKGTVQAFARAMVGRGPEALVARRYLLGLFTIAGAAAETIQYARTGTHVDFNPRSDNFFLIKTPDAVLQPLGRWRALAKLLFNPEDGEAYARWVRGRLSQPVTVLRGLNPVGIFSNTSFWGDPVVTKEGLPGWWQRVKFMAKEGALPVPATQIMKDVENDAFSWESVVLNVFGVSRFATSAQEKLVQDTVERLVVEAGADPLKTREKRLGDGRILNVTGPDGKAHLLLNAAKEDIVAKAAVELGLPEEVIRRYGGEEKPQSLAEQRAVKKRMRDLYFDSVDNRRMVEQAEYKDLGDQAQRGEMSWAEASEEITALRRGWRMIAAHDGVVYADTIKDLEKRRDEAVAKGEYNEVQYMLDAIAEGLWGDGIVDRVGRIDYGLRDVNERELRKKYGDALVDQLMAEGQRRKPTWVQERDHDVIDVLRPYWEMPKTVLSAAEQAAYTTYIATPDNLQPRLLATSGTTKRAVLKVDAARKGLRRRNKATIDRALVKWYDRIPIDRVGIGLTPDALHRYTDPPEAK